MHKEFYLRWLSLLCLLCISQKTVADIGVTIYNASSTNISAAFKIGITPTVMLANGPNHATRGPGETFWGLGVNNQFAGSNYLVMHWKSHFGGDQDNLAYYQVYSEFTMPAAGGSISIPYWGTDEAPVTPTGDYCFTNTFAMLPIMVQITTAAGNTVTPLRPGEFLCVDSQTPFRMDVLELLPGFEQVTNGPNPNVFTPIILTNLNNLMTFDGTNSTSGGGNSGDLMPPKVPPGNPLFPNPTNDAQKAANAAIAGNSEANKALALSLVAIQDILTTMEKKMATNLNAGATNAGDATIASGVGAISNYVAGIGGTMTNAVVGSMANILGEAPTDVDGEIEINFGTAAAPILVDVNPFGDGSIFAPLITWVRRALIAVALFLFAKYSWQAWEKAIFCILTNTTGGSTSGFLQAGPLSIPQLLSSMTGVFTRWGFVGSAMTLATLSISVAVAARATSLGGYQVSNLSAGLGAGVGNGMGWLVKFIPIDACIELSSAYVVIRMIMLFCVMYSAAVSDVTSKA
jgi:hypothetical protein